MTTSDELAVELRKLFIDRFSLDEMIDLAFNLDPRAGDLGQTTKNGMARELALYVVRRDWVARLINEVGPQERPDIDWKTALPGFASASLLSDDDRRKLIDVLAHTYDMVLGPPTRFSLLQRSGVEERAWHINLTGAASEVAQKIVADLEPLGILPSKPGYHALGALSDYIRQLSDTKQDDARALAELIVKYQLITDRDYLDKLTASFNVNVGAVRQVDPALRPPSIKDNELLMGAIDNTQAGGRIEMPAEGVVGTGFLTNDDRHKLIETLAMTYEMQMGVHSRRALLDMAGLGYISRGIELSGEPLQVSQILVAALEPFGILPNQPVYHALGALANLIIQLPDTTKSDARFLAELIIKHQLINDRDYVDKLQESFDINVKTVRQEDVALRPPSIKENISLTQVGTSLSEVGESSFLDADSFAGALYCAQAVGRVERPSARPLGTGFLIGPDLILTTNSVFKSKEMLSEAVIRFDYQANTDGVVTQGRVFEFLPDFYVGSPPEELDFALVRLKGEPLVERKLQPGDEGLDYLEMLRRGRHRGYLLVAPKMILKYEQVGAIHHPLGGPQKIVLTDNFVLADMTAVRVHYMNFSRLGSSGAPLLNRRWEVIAMHHSGGAYPPIKDPALAMKLRLEGMRFSEGIPMRAILPLIEQYLPRQ